MASEVGRNEKQDFRLPCCFCCRKFTSEALGRHEKICEKTSQKKRKIFDSAKQRRFGTDLPATVSSAPVQLTSSPSRKEKRPTGLLGKRQSKSSQPSNIERGQKPHPLTIQNRLAAGFIQCPTCERNFNDKAAERHIVWCKEQRARIPRSPPCNDAKERLVARIQYKAPLPGKRRPSPPRGVRYLKKTWSSPLPSIQHTPSLSPGCPANVKVTGTAIKTHSRHGDPKKNSVRSISGSVSSLSNEFGDGDNSSMIHSTSWEWVSPKFSIPVTRPSPPPKPSRKNANSKTPSDKNSNKINMLPVKVAPISDKSPTQSDGDYDPYVSAQRQMEELMQGTEANSAVRVTPKPVPSNRHSTNQVRENKLRSSNPSTLSSDSEKNVEEIEEMIEEMFEDLNLNDSSVFEEPVARSDATRDKPNWLPRRAVSREEALFGTKNSSGSQDSDYGSLLIHRSPSSPARLSPAQRSGAHTSDLNERNLIMSTSSSETSLPPLGISADGRFTRFCHECGTQYPVTSAKFCSECGVKRVYVV